MELVNYNYKMAAINYLKIWKKIVKLLQIMKRCFEL